MKNVFSGFFLLENHDSLKQDTTDRKIFLKCIFHFQLPGISLMLVKCSMLIFKIKISFPISRAALFIILS